MDAIIISHSRIDLASGKVSEVWSSIVEGAIEFSLGHKKEIAVLAPTKSYNDIEEYYSLVRKATKLTKKIILPFSKGSPEFVEMLNDFKGEIVFVNTPPPKEWKEKLTKEIPYVGLDEYLIGLTAAETLLGFKNHYRKVLVLRHEKSHEGHNLRIEGIKSSGLEVVELFIDPEKGKCVIPPKLRHLSVITLGIRGTEVALRSKSKTIIAIDSNEEIETACKEGKILAILLQDPKSQGKLAAEKLFSGDKKDYFMRPQILYG